jgi:hypothetical protein
LSFQKFWLVAISELGGELPPRAGDELRRLPPGGDENG